MNINDVFDTLDELRKVRKLLRSSTVAQSRAGIQADIMASSLDKRIALLQNEIDEFEEWVNELAQAEEMRHV
jgi:hypothetical protein